MIVSSNNRYENLDGLKVIAAFGIVAMHVSANMGHPLTSIFTTNIIGTMTHFVKLFLILSGFGMCCGYYVKFKEGKADIEKFYKRRFSKNMPFFVLLVFIDTLVSIRGVIWRDVFASLTMAFNLMPTHDMSIVGVGWTLGAIFVFYFLFPFYVFLLSTKKRAWCTAGICLILNWCCCNYYEFVGKADGANFLFLSVYFVVGGMIYLYKEDIEKKMRQVPVYVAILVILVILLVTIVWYLIPSSEFSVWFTLKTIILFVVWIVAAISYKSKILGNSITKKLSKVSLEIYLSHMMLFRVVEKIGFSNRITNKNISYLTTLFFTIILTIIFSVFAKSVIDSCLRKLKNWR